MHAGGQASQAALDARAPYLVWLISSLAAVAVSVIYHCRGAWCFVCITYQTAVGDHALRSSGHVLKSISLLADRMPRSPLVLPTTFLAYMQNRLTNSQRYFVVGLVWVGMVSRVSRVRVTAYCYH